MVRLDYMVAVKFSSVMGPLGFDSVNRFLKVLEVQCHILLIGAPLS